jgi:hypothetical protein
MKIILFVLAFLFSALIIPSCKKDNPIPPEEQPQADLTLEDVSCTEAWLRLSTSNITLPANVELLKNDTLNKTFSLVSADTILYIDSLLPNQTYSFHTIIQPYNHTDAVTSAPISVTTMDITSHNFTWQTFTFGDPSAGSSTLYDVAIIGSEIWAVGQIYLLDSLGQPDPYPYNLAKWNGVDWELQKVNYHGTPPIIHSIACINDNDIWLDPWFHWYGQIMQQMPIDPVLIGIDIFKMWGNSNGLYVVGDNGKIVFRNSSGIWSNIESGTVLNIIDICGTTYPVSNSLKILAIATLSGESKILSVSSNIARDTLNWPINQGIAGIWLNKMKTYVSGMGVWEFNNGIWQLQTDTDKFYYRIKGSQYNNIFAAGDFNMIHFNGATWQIVNNGSTEIIFMGLDVSSDFTVGVGFTENGPVVGQAAILMGQR